jgi:hypothetical protein
LTICPGCAWSAKWTYLKWQQLCHRHLVDVCSVNLADFLNLGNYAQVVVSVDVQHAYDAVDGPFVYWRRGFDHVVVFCYRDLSVVATDDQSLNALLYEVLAAYLEGQEERLTKKWSLF